MIVSFLRCDGETIHEKKIGKSLRRYAISGPTGWSLLLFLDKLGWPINVVCDEADAIQWVEEG